MPAPKEALEFRGDVRTGRAQISIDQQINYTSPSSGNWGEVFGVVRLPEEVRGLTILDVGAGGSDATWKLNQMGANAYAVDPKYEDTPTLIADTKEANNALAQLGNRQVRDIRNGALERFKQSARKNPDKYLAESAHQLSFPDNLFDIVFSRNSVLTYLDWDRKILNNIINELLRVTKSGGSIRLFPFMADTPGDLPELSQLRYANHLFLRESLSKNRLVQAIEEVPVVDGEQVPLLIIHKA